MLLWSGCALQYLLLGRRLSVPALPSAYKADRGKLGKVGIPRSGAATALIFCGSVSASHASTRRNTRWQNVSIRIFRHMNLQNFPWLGAIFFVVNVKMYLYKYCFLPIDVRDVS